LLRHIMLYNNLAYHLHLMGDPMAADYAQAGLRLAEERGSLSHLPFLLSTSGEIALAGNDLDAAEAYFSQGLALAEQIPVPERIAGLTANLGLVARQRGQSDLARQRLSDALERADQLGTGHLGVRIRIWLAPLLPPAEARQRLREARHIAQPNGYHRLLEEITQLEQSLAPA
jgi:tetratricopeptide (TPR) repeat protein